MLLENPDLFYDKYLILYLEYEDYFPLKMYRNIKKVGWRFV